MKRTTLTGIIIAIIVIVLVVVLALAARKKSMMTAGLSGDQAGQQAAGAASPAPGASPAGDAAGPGEVLGKTPNQQVSEKSDLVTFSVSAGSTILGSKPATGTIDASYVSGSSISIQLANTDGKVMKTIKGTVTGSNAVGNKTFSADISTSGVTKGAGYIVFRQASGSRSVMIPVIFE